MSTRNSKFLHNHNLILEKSSCLSLLEEQNSYIFGFADKNGELYDFHVSDDLKSRRTWESVEFKFSLPDSKYILVWKRNKAKFTKREANDMIDYVKEDMEEYMVEGKESKTEGEGSQTKISSMLIPTNECLIITYDRLILPTGNINWKNYVDILSISIDEMMEESIQGINDREQIEDMLEGRDV